MSAVLAEICAFWKVLAQKAIGIFIAPALPRALRVTTVDVDPRFGYWYSYKAISDLRSMACVNVLADIGWI